MGINELNKCSILLNALREYLQFFLMLNVKFQHIISRGGKDESTGLDFDEFVDYMVHHENKLKLAFTHLDRNKDGEKHNIIFNFKSEK